MKDLFLKMKKRNERYNFGILFTVAAMFFITIFEKDINLINLWLGIILLPFGILLWLLVIAKDKELEIEKLEIIESDKEFLKFKEFLKPYIERDLMYSSFLEAYTAFQNEKKASNDKNIIIRRNFKNKVLENEKA
ncbi:hypothetical protein [Aliarcobacter butzleri]|uniref:hypothetical protein n=1 Tax=Aliarcobacter butzleri TaxID=28197 RepID=UPI00126A6EAA|nr:hypothetical protein [Aliarcobacter butzleri]